MSIKDDLKNLILGEILDDEPSLKTFSTDASAFSIKPQAIIFPHGTKDIQQLVKYATERQVSLTARAAGTDMSGGAINDSMILEMTNYFNKIIEIGQDYAVVEPGVYYRDLEKATLEKNLLLPCYPASRELCTVGGMAANNSAGEKTLQLGQTKDYVLELKAVLSDGNEYLIKPLNETELKKKSAQKDFEGKLYKQIYDLIEENYDLIQKARPATHKNSTGYLLWDVWDKKTFDLSKLLVGSQGTLGIITQIKFRLIKPKPHSRMLVIFLKDISNLAAIINKILEFKPESFESYDDQTLKIATKFLPEILKVFKPTSLISLLFSFLPEMIMSITGGFPKLVMIAEFTADTEKKATDKCLKAQTAIKQFNLKTRVTASEDEAKKYWTLRRESFNLLRHHSENMRTAPIIDDIIVRPENLPEFLPKLQTILNDYKNLMIYTIAGHIGEGNFHIIPLMNFSDEKIREIIPELMNRVYDLVIKYHGSISAEHNDGLVRGPFLEKMYGEDIYQLFKKVKEIFDPNDIFNPHKKIDATLKYSMNHLAKN